MHLKCNMVENRTWLCNHAQNTDSELMCNTIYQSSLRSQFCDSSIIMVCIYLLIHAHPHTHTLQQSNTHTHNNYRTCVRRYMYKRIHSLCVTLCVHIFISAVDSLDDHRTMNNSDLRSRYLAVVTAVLNVVLWVVPIIFPFIQVSTCSHICRCSRIFLLIYIVPMFYLP